MIRRLISHSLVASACGLAALMLMAGPARASDGVLEISATCATVGCFPGDSPGYPITLANPGSYRLTSDLEPAGADGIEIATTALDIDLGGFAIRGPGNCTGTGGAFIACTGNAGTGINGVIGLGDNVTTRIHNGTITGMSGAIGLFFVSDATLENLRIVENEGTTISLGNGAKVRNLYVSRNGGDAISIFLLGANYSIQDSVISLNGGDGITAGGGVGLVRGNLIHDNAGWGVISEFVNSPTAQPALFDNNVTGNDLGQLRGGTTTGENFCSPVACP